MLCMKSRRHQAGHYECYVHGIKASGLPLSNLSLKLQSVIFIDAQRADLIPACSLTFSLCLSGSLRLLATY